MGIKSIRGLSKSHRAPHGRYVTLTFGACFLTIKLCMQNGGATAMDDEMARCVQRAAYHYQELSDYFGSARTPVWVTARPPHRGHRIHSRIIEIIYIFYKIFIIVSVYLYSAIQLT